jgi:DNA-binding transcriptional regulator YiaG
MVVASGTGLEIGACTMERQQHRSGSIQRQSLTNESVEMNEIERLRGRIAKRFPTAHLSVDAPGQPSGSWWLDVKLNDHVVVVEWRPGRGFGISTVSEDAYGVGPDEIYTDADAAFERVKALLLGQVRTISTPELPLSSLREARNLSQVELAQRLRINQGSLSRAERRTEMLIGTLRNMIAAMGGELELRARFPDGSVRIRLDESASSDFPEERLHPGSGSAPGAHESNAA